MKRGRRSTRTPRTGGFTLIEVIVVIGILTFGLLALASMQLQAMKGGGRGRHATQALTIGEAQMERLQRLRWTSLTVTNWSTAVPITDSIQNDGSSVAEQTFSRSHRITDVTADWTRSIDVRVNWTEPGGYDREVTLSSIRFNREGL